MNDSSRDPVATPATPATPAPRSVIVVLGSGRSGTSLLMQVLATMGMRVSEDLIAARRDNPRGFFEDAPIVRAQADLMRGLGAWPYHPLPAYWLESPASASAAQVLAAVLRARLDQGGATWGFKDPRTAPFLPLWQRLFRELDIAPRYVLALREPGSVIRSFMAAYQTPADIAEDVWLRRTCAALLHTRGECHIVHYEDWFSQGREVAAALARYLGLKEADTAGLEQWVRPELNRAGTTGDVLGNPAARRLNEALAACRGDAFDRGRLLQVVADCRAES